MADSSYPSLFYILYSFLIFFMDGYMNEYVYIPTLEKVSKIVKFGYEKMLEDNKTLEPFNKVYTIELGIQNCQISSRRYKLLESGPVTKETLHTDEQDNDFIENSYNTYL